MGRLLNKKSEKGIPGKFKFSKNEKPSMHFSHLKTYRVAGRVTIPFCCKNLFPAYEMFRPLLIKILATIT